MSSLQIFQGLQGFHHYIIHLRGKNRRSVARITFTIVLIVSRLYRWIRLASLLAGCVPGRGSCLSCSVLISGEGLTFWASKGRPNDLSSCCLLAPRSVSNGMRMNRNRKITERLHQMQMRVLCVSRCGLPSYSYSCYEGGC